MLEFDAKFEQQAGIQPVFESSEDDLYDMYAGLGMVEYQLKEERQSE
jgi:hypothetical protein